MTNSAVDAHLEMDPGDTIEFSLSTGEATPRVTLTLRHPDAESNPVAFKVKTTQPRRYLVRPNQGLIKPGGKEVVQILLVEKDKNQLLASYESLGAAALDHCKDKFLVQSVAVTPSQAQKLQEYDELTALWASSPTAVANKKLHVRHTVSASDAAGSAATAAPTSTQYHSSTIAPADMSKEQLVPELTSLRRKYDELVAFSVNLTAERDMLANTVEQTKRDLNREIASKQGGGGSGRPSALTKAQTKSSSKGVNLMTVIFLCLLAVFVGAKLQQAGWLEAVPFIGRGGGFIHEL